MEHYPFRHVDKTKLDKIADLSPNNEYAQIAGKIIQIDILGEGKGKRLTATLQDETGEIELVWFRGISWIQKAIQVDQPYLVFGRLSFFIGKPQIAHPEIENFTAQKADGKYYLEPVYASTEKLKAKGLNFIQASSKTRMPFDSFTTPTKRIFAISISDFGVRFV